MALLVHGGHVLNSSYTALERADILIEADRIRAVGQALGLPPTPTVSMPPGAWCCLAW